MSAKVTREEFRAFQRLQKDGSYNMIDPVVRMIAGLTKEKHLYILNHYGELEKEYGELY